MMTILPLSDHVVIKPEIEGKTASGIIIPDTAAEKPQVGKVVAAGPEASVREGAVVLFRKWGGNEVAIDGEDVLIIRSEDILATLIRQKKVTKKKGAGGGK